MECLIRDFFRKEKMKASTVVKLRPGTKLRLKNTGQEVTVKDVLLSPTAEEPKGRFPLVVTEEHGAVTYLLLRFPTFTK